jgi:hypothetical protein
VKTRLEGIVAACGWPQRSSSFINWTGTSSNGMSGHFSCCSSSKYENGEMKSKKKYG